MKTSAIARTTISSTNMIMCVQNCGSVEQRGGVAVVAVGVGVEVGLGFCVGVGIWVGGGRVGKPVVVHKPFKKSFFGATLENLQTALPFSSVVCRLRGFAEVGFFCSIRSCTVRAILL